MWHVGYWLFVLIVSTLIPKYDHLSLQVVFEEFILSNIVIAGFFYLHCLYFIPYLFKRNHVKTFWLVLVASMVIIPLVSMVVYSYLGNYVPSFKPDPAHSLGMRYGMELQTYLFNFLLFSVMLYFMERNEMRRTKIEQEQEQMAIQQVALDTLKTQVSPEFLLQSLNQLKALTLQKSTAAPEAVITFSDLLRFRLYRGREGELPLAEELQALQSLVRFTTLGLQDGPDVELETQGDACDYTIAPLTLVNLAELFCRRPEIATLQVIVMIAEGELNAEFIAPQAFPDELLAELEEYEQNLHRFYGDNITFMVRNTITESILSVCLPIRYKELPASS
jgi:hypothetical protein